jgi:acyl dehydratase
MIAKVDYASVEPGTEIPEREFVVERRTLLMYCGACSDFAPIHWNERIAKSVGLPDVIAHGTLTMAKAIRAVTDWAGDPGLSSSRTTTRARSYA